jgi:hypothetical protein
VTSKVSQGKNEKKETNMFMELIGLRFKSLRPDHGHGGGGTDPLPILPILPELLNHLIRPD